MPALSPNTPFGAFGPADRRALRQPELLHPCALESWPIGERIMAMQTTAVRVLQVGCGGYGAFILRGLLDLQAEGLVQVVAGVDPAPRGAGAEVLAEAGLKAEADLDQALARHRPELVVIASPIHLHATHAISAMAQGAHVLCEKPAAGNLEDAQAMAAAARQYDRWCAIGFQWSYSPAVLQLKADIAAGRLGRPEELASCVLWARAHSYYQRNQWAGRAWLDGRWLGDSILSNATAHHLHHHLFLLGADGAAAAPDRMQAALGRVNAIDTCDSAVVDVMVGDTHIRHCASHAVAVEWAPLMRGRFSEGLLDYRPEAGGFIFQPRQGSARVYGDPEAHPHHKLRHCVLALREGTPIPCDVNCASVHLGLVEALQRPHDQGPSPAGEAPAELVGEVPMRGGSGLAVKGLEHGLLRCWANGAEAPAWFQKIGQSHYQG
ncbi:MAG: gfo/Idh/MocA family oxidoreductase [Planctomycetota bacterium]|nr:MAG: gfo/Idh/MocA family oxidoreductase [Planctomycetota bacterium]